jgi:nuclear protein localization family protein 4
LYKEGWFVEDCPDLDPKLSRMAKDVVILSKDTRDVDNDFFLVLVKILDHEVQFSFLSVLLRFLPISVSSFSSCCTQTWCGPWI